jgi:hypothetical protein
MRNWESIIDLDGLLKVRMSLGKKSVISSLGSIGRKERRWTIQNFQTYFEDKFIKNLIESLIIEN